jgi:hypothetical protein
MLAKPQILVFGHSTEVSTGVSKQKHFIHTFKFVKLFPMKIYQNYVREEIDADQCYLFNGAIKGSENTLFNAMIINEYHTGKYGKGGDCDLVLGNTLEWFWRD